MLNEDAFIDFNCPHCAEPVSFPALDAKFARECPVCSATLIVPAQAGAPGQALPLPLKSSKLLLRRFSLADWQGLMECLGLEQEEQAVQWLERDSVVRLTTPEQPFHLAIELQPSGQLLGYARLQFIDPERLQAMVSLTLNPSLQEPALAIEALDALLCFCFEGINLHRVTATCPHTSTEDIKSFQAVGMRQEGEFVQNCLAEGQWLNSLWFGLLQAEYLAAP